MNFRTALHDGKVARIELLGNEVKVIIDKIPSTHTGTDSVRKALEEWESDPAEDMYKMLSNVANGDSISSSYIDRVLKAYRKGSKQESFKKCDPKAIVIELSYNSKEYRTWTGQASATSKDPFEAIKLVLENHNYDVHEEMYEVLKEIQKAIPTEHVEKVIKRYENE